MATKKTYSTKPIDKSSKIDCQHGCWLPINTSCAAHFTRGQESETTFWTPYVYPTTTTACPAHTGATPRSERLIHLPSCSTYSRTNPLSLLLCHFMLSLTVRKSKLSLLLVGLNQLSSCPNFHAFQLSCHVPAEHGTMCAFVPHSTCRVEYSRWNDFSRFLSTTTS